MSGLNMMLAAAAGAAVVSPLLGGFAYDFDASARASYTFNPDGSVDVEAATNVTNSQQWFKPVQSAVGAGYWIRATKTSGTTPGGDALATWLQLNVARQWYLRAAPNNDFACTLTIQIATDSAGTNIVTSGGYSIEADANFL